MTFVALKRRYISFVEMFAFESIDMFMETGLSKAESFRYSTFGFFAGVLFEKSLELLLSESTIKWASKVKSRFFRPSIQSFKAPVARPTSECTEYPDTQGFVSHDDHRLRTGQGPAAADGAVEDSISTSLVVSE